MTDENKQSVGTDYLSPVSGKNKKSLKIFLFASAGVLVAAVAILAVLLIGNANSVTEDRVVRVMEYGTVLKGVSVGGVDISGLIPEEAYAATANVEEDLLLQASFEIDLDGDILSFDAAAFSLETDYNDMIGQAIAYGHTGSFEERQQAAQAARTDGVNFTVDVLVDKAKVSAALAALDTTFNAAPMEASYTFMPNGYFADGTAYDPETYDENTLGAPQLVRVDAADKPNPLRYQYWQNTKYVANYIPKDADIARFLYIPEQKGLKTDLAKLADLIVAAVENDDYAVITAPTEATEPTMTLEQIKASTQLVASWTSSYSNHDSSNRIHNVTKMASIINGVELEPDVTWSINAQAGPRTKANGWKEAAGISSGAFVPDPGGGVCQISSTLYNAALRANLEIVDSKRHSIISDYIPIGLDATISTGSPDLKFKNPNATPMYIVSYMNKDEKNVTVEIYGPPVVHPEYGEILLHFSSDKTGTGATPETIYHYNATTTPDGESIGAGKSKTYVQARGSTTATVYIHYLKPDGTEIKKDLLYKTSYRAYKGQVYVNGPDPSIPVVTPTPVPEPTPEPPPAPSDEGGG